jgi:Mg2+ and Co2+ transporter CorA
LKIQIHIKELIGGQVYTFMAAKDNITNIGIAADSKKIAAASKKDSSAMKTIAVLTMLFLPATFVAVSLRRLKI